MWSRKFHELYYCVTTLAFPAQRRRAAFVKAGRGPWKEAAVHRPGHAGRRGLGKAGQIEPGPPVQGCPQLSPRRTLPPVDGVQSAVATFYGFFAVERTAKRQPHPKRCASPWAARARIASRN